MPNKTQLQVTNIITLSSLVTSLYLFQRWVAEHKTILLILAGVLLIGFFLLAWLSCKEERKAAAQEQEPS